MGALRLAKALSSAATSARVADCKRSRRAWRRRPHLVQRTHFVPVARSTPQRALTGTEWSLQRLHDLADSGHFRPAPERMAPLRAGT